MAINLTSNYKQINEQDLVQDLIEESIEQRGFQVHYIVRDMINPDLLLGESTISDFTEFYLIPMFLESMEHFNGSGDLYDEFGMSYNDAAIFQVGSRRFRQEINDPKFPRPKEGDLVYVPFSDSLWEITKVKNDLQYYQMGKNYTHRLICKLFEYSHENIENQTDTDFNELSSVVDIDDEGLQRVLGLKSDDRRDDNTVLKDEKKKFETFNPDEPFQF